MWKALFFGESEIYSESGKKEELNKNWRAIMTAS